MDELQEYFHAPRSAAVQLSGIAKQMPKEAIVLLDWATTQHDSGVT